MTPQELEDQKETLELINSELAARLTRQADSGAKVDAKAIFLVGFAATAAQFLASRSFEPFTGAVSFAAYAGAIGFGISVFNLAEYDDIKPREVLDTYARSEKGATLGALAGTRVGMFEKNARLHQRKTKRWTVALVAVAAGIVLSTVSLVLHTGGHDSTEPGGHAPAPTSSAQPHRLARQPGSCGHGEEERRPARARQGGHPGADRGTALTRAARAALAIAARQRDPGPLRPGVSLCSGMSDRSNDPRTGVSRPLHTQLPQRGHLVLSELVAPGLGR